ncbi:anti-sigma factor domain-containing protein [Streptomyces sp. NPDC058579]|uniref:anti-sigma factor n=1 Tax=Streptomyces sp. NPDC058579 TaxID=3346548 RepID=UPI0036462366
MRQHRSDLHALSAAYALHALESSERADFAAHLVHCEDCRREVAEFEATTARLAAAASQTPPQSLKRQTLSEIDGVRQLPPQVSAAGPKTSFAHRLKRKAVPLSLAASIAAAVSFAGVAAWQHQEIENAQRQAQRAEQQLGSVSTVLAAPDARTAHGRTTNGALTTVVTSERQNKAVFTASGLPAPTSGHTYQLWLDHAGTMQPAGFLHDDGTVLIDGDPAEATAVGLTLEPTGGSPQPTTQPLLLLALPS